MIIELTVPSVYESEGVRLLPGKNEVDDKKAQKLLANKIVKLDIEAGKIVVEKAKPVRKPKSETVEAETVETTEAE